MSDVMLYSDVKMTNKEREEYDNFCECHRRCVSRTPDREKILLLVSETGIGSRLICKCNVCGVEVDITDYSCW